MPAGGADRPADLLTTARVAELLQVHPKQVYRLVRRGMPASRLGGEWRFARDRVLAWLGERDGVDAEAPTQAEPAPRAVAPAAAEAPLVPPLVAANGDVVVERLLGRANAAGAPLLGLVRTDRAQAMKLLERRSVLAAGCHGEAPPPRLGADRLARIHLVTREVGLAAPKGKAVPALARLPGLRFAARPPTAGIVAALESAAKKEALGLSELLAGANLYAAHEEVACAVARGEADVGLVTRAWADRVGLAFRPLGREGYGLLVHAESLGDPRVVRLCETAQSDAYRRDIAAVHGYDASGAGDIRYDP